MHDWDAAAANGMHPVQDIIVLVICMNFKILCQQQYLRNGKRIDSDKGNGYM